MSAQGLSRDPIPHAHLMRAVLDGHHLQWFCRDAMKWQPFATPTDALRALLSDDATLVRIKPAVDTAIDTAAIDLAADADAQPRPPTAPLAWWPRHGQIVYRADPDGPTGSEPLCWKGTSEQRRHFERRLLYVDEYSAMAAWRNRHEVREPESNVIYCEFDRSTAPAALAAGSEKPPVCDPAAAAIAM